jgi:peptide/nickel transport system substrate-binding protein
MKKILLVVITVLVSLTMTGCNKEEEKDSLVVYSSVTAENFDFYAGSIIPFEITDNVMGTLFRWDDEGGVEPFLAESVTYDGLTATIHLREDVTFHNGDAFTADDVIYTLDYAATQPTYAPLMPIYFSSWEKVDDYTIEIEKAAAYIRLEKSFADWVTILPKNAHSEDMEAFKEHPIGAGPYEFVSMATDGSITLQAYDGFFGDTPQIKNITIKSPVDPSTAVIALESGEVDLLNTIPTSQLEILESNPDVTLLETTTWTMDTLWLMGPNFADENLRKAVQVGINPVNTIASGYDGLGSAPQEIFADLQMGDLLGEHPYPQYNLTTAQSYLSASSYESSTELVIGVTAEYSAIAQVIQGELSTLGITVTIETLDFNSLNEKMLNSELDMTIMALGGPLYAFEQMATFYLAPMYYNILHGDQEFVTDLSTMLATVDDTARLALASDVLEYMVNLADFIPLNELTGYVAHNSDLQGVPAILGATYHTYFDDFSWE